MPTLLSTRDLLPLTSSPTFVADLVDQVEASLRDEPEPGHASFLRFPAGPGGRKVQLYPISDPSHGMQVRITPVTASGEHPRNADLVVALRPEDGSVRAVVGTDALTPWRTAGPVAVAVRHLAPPGARVAAILGAGEQARYHVRALRVVLPGLEQVRLYNRSEARRDRLIREEGDARLVAMGTVEAAIADADVVCVVAAGTARLFPPEALKSGALVTTINPAAAPLQIPRLCIPTRKLAEVRPSGWDPFPARPEGPLSPERAPLALPEVIRRERPARGAPGDVVLHVQIGAGAWDTWILDWVLRWAESAGAGTPFELSAG